MKAGQLNRRIEIQEKQGGLDEYGEPIPGQWTTIHTVWASIRLLSGMTAVKSNIEVSVINASVRIRYLPGITAAMRIVYDNKYYDIQAVLNDEAGRVYTDILAKVGINTG
ncbi:MAG: phage head closure protein [Castellaniella sp.]|uniref:phage head closure protein n=1 Tax=Castellaniella sp. TaxID=1955812 RepID=UPI003A85B569